MGVCPIFEKEIVEGCNYELDGLAFASISELLAHVNKSKKKKITHEKMKGICLKCRERK
ncbi:hypothetical protein HY992_04765 [Candidatus Micrarchaeota archaeon]|nr:hypothetical protein [Candidatus Micrarchaeota archaeon]